MDTNPPDTELTVIDVAVQFMAGPGRAERLLAVHRRLPDGLCAGCLTQLTKWPCPVASIALQAQRQKRR
jgi:hypothetical protein